MTPADLKITTNATLGPGIWGCPIDVRIGLQGHTRVYVSVAINHDVPIESNPSGDFAN